MANEYTYSPGEYAREFEGFFVGYSFFEVGYEKTYDDCPINGAFRFLDVTQSGTISAASLMFQAYAVYPDHNQSVKARIRGLDYGDYGVLNDNNPFSGKNYTTASVNKSWGDTHTGSWIEVNVKSIIDEIFARGDWSSGNNIALIVEDNGTDSDTDRSIVSANAYLMIRKTAVPDFTPTPTIVSAPSLPDPEDWGIKISKPGSSVLSAPEADLYFTTRRKTVKVLAEDIYTSSGAGDTTIAHNLGYVPFVNVFGKEIGGNWRRLPIAAYFSDRITYYINDTNLVLHSAQSGEKFYYRIFVDRVTS